MGFSVLGKMPTSPIREQGPVINSGQVGGAHFVALSVVVLIN